MTLKRLSTAAFRDTSASEGELEGLAKRWIMLYAEGVPLYAAPYTLSQKGSNGLFFFLAPFFLRPR